MSLINDALRRANQEKKQPSPEASGGAPMQPVHPAKQTTNWFAPLLIVFIITVLLISAGWFFWKGWSAKEQEKQEPLAQTSAQGKMEPEVAPVAIEPTPHPSEKPTTVVSNEAIASTNRADLTDGISSNVAVVVETAPPPPEIPVLKLQGIFYRATNPSALISGVTVGVGDKVRGARVTKIEKQEVTLERNGETIVLTLEQ